MISKVSEFIKKAQEYSKFIAAVVGGVFIVVSGNLELPADVVKWVQIGVAILTAFAVYQFPNVSADEPGKHVQ